MLFCECGVIILIKCPSVRSSNNMCVCSLRFAMNSCLCRSDHAEPVALQFTGGFESGIDSRHVVSTQFGWVAPSSPRHRRGPPQRKEASGADTSTMRNWQRPREAQESFFAQYRTSDLQPLVAKLLPLPGLGHRSRCASLFLRYRTTINYT